MPDPPDPARRLPPWAIATSAAIVVLAGAIVAAALIVSGDGETQPTVTVAAPPATAPAPAPAAPPATTPSGPEPLSTDSVLSPGALGPVEVGQTLDEAELAAGVPLRAEEVTPGCEIATPEEGPAGVSFLVYEGVVERIDVSSPAIETDTGLSVGVSADLVRSTLGDALTETTNQASGQPWLVYRPEGPDAPELVFSIGEGEVRSITAGPRRFAEASEGCL